MLERQSEDHLEKSPRDFFDTESPFDTETVRQARAVLVDVPNRDACPDRKQEVLLVENLTGED
jgi:hypothetical protein